MRHCRGTECAACREFLAGPAERCAEVNDLRRRSRNRPGASGVLRYSGEPKNQEQRAAEAQGDQGRPAPALKHNFPASVIGKMTYGIKQAS